MLLIPIGICAFLILAIIIFFAKYTLFSKQQHFESEICDEKNQPLPSICKHELIFHGQHSETWKGTFGEKSVAIKNFKSSASTKAWTDEKDIYTRYDLKHDNILVFLAAFKLEENNSLEHVLVTEYAQHGSLYSYLLSIKCLNIENILRLMSSIANGLAFLHRSSRNKPIIAHRDLKSQNILVTEGLNCCIGDFGLAIAFDDNGEIPKTAKNQVGQFLYEELHVHAKDLISFKIFIKEEA